MTDETGFQNWLDAHPEDSVARMAFADWLEERGDERHAGYRALGVSGLYAVRVLMDRDPMVVRYIVGNANNKLDSPQDRRDYGPCQLPHAWMYRVENLNDEDDRGVWWKYFLTRREAEDAAALAYARLLAKRESSLQGVS